MTTKKRPKQGVIRMITRSPFSCCYPTTEVCSKRTIHIIIAFHSAPHNTRSRTKVNSFIVWYLAHPLQTGRELPNDDKQAGCGSSGAPHIIIAHTSRVRCCVCENSRNTSLISTARCVSLTIPASASEGPLMSGNLFAFKDGKSPRTHDTRWSFGAAVCSVRYVMLNINIRNLKRNHRIGKFSFTAHKDTPS